MPPTSAGTPAASAEDASGDDARRIDARSEKLWRADMDVSRGRPGPVAFSTDDDDQRRGGARPPLDDARRVRVARCMNASAPTCVQ